MTEPKLPAHIDRHGCILPPKLLSYSDLIAQQRAEAAKAHRPAGPMCYPGPTGPAGLNGSVGAPGIQVPDGVNGPNPKDLAGRCKPDLSLVTGQMIAHLASALQTGQEKYGLKNWRERDVEARTYSGAAVRHVKKFEDGEDFDPDTQSTVHHLALCAASALVLLDAIENGKVIDNRGAKGNATACMAEISRKRLQLALNGYTKPKTAQKFGVFFTGGTRGDREETRSLALRLEYDTLADANTAARNYATACGMPGCGRWFGKALPMNPKAPEKFGVFYRNHEGFPQRSNDVPDEFGTLGEAMSAARANQESQPEAKCYWFGQRITPEHS
jgi:dATP/dGTP diphosphohydrolase